MLNHIFRNEHYEMILTYLWVLYMQPKHPLPFIGLVSTGKGTGKTKFLQFLKAIFQANAKFIDAEDISANFNSSYIDKLCILIDEKIDGKHRKADLQKYKKLVTGGTQTRKEKYQTDVDVEFYGKFIMCSNDSQTMIALEEENTRFWIIEVNRLTNVDLDILNKVSVEIPAFLHHLQHEYVPSNREGRLWLSTESIQTERGKVLQENSKSSLAKEIIERLKDYFTQNETYKEIAFSATHFSDAFSMKNVSVEYIGRVLNSEFDKEQKTKEIRNPFLDYDCKISRSRSYTFSKEEIMGVQKENIEEREQINGSNEYYDPNWIEGEFD